MKLPPNLNVYVSAALFVIGAYVAALYLGLIVWTFRDIRSRTRDMLAHIMAALLVAVFNLPGLLIYMLVRPKTTLAEEYDRTLAEEAVLHELDARLLCPSCQRDIETDYVVCPSCHHQLKLRCIGCGRLVMPAWDVCPYCVRYQEGEADTPAPDTAMTDTAAPETPDPDMTAAAMAAFDTEAEPDVAPPASEDSMDPALTAPEEPEEEIAAPDEEDDEPSD